MKKLFLHIGPAKTGTTTLQAFLYKNKDNLRNSGYLYPKTGIKNFAGQHNLAQLIEGSKLGKPEAGDWKELHKEIEESSLDKIIISSEFFSMIKNKKKINILKSELVAYEVKVIVYLRRQDIRLESQYTQNVKNGIYTSDILSFIEKRKNGSDYYGLLKPWKQVFGSDNLIVRPLEKTQVPNICHDLLKIIGINDCSHFDEVISKNIRPGRKAIEILQLANKVYQDRPEQERKRSIRRIKSYLQANWTEECKYRLLSYEDSSKILEFYKESNQAVAREYLGREEGVLFYETLESYENDPFTIEDLSKEDLLGITLALSGKMVISNKKSKP